MQQRLLLLPALTLAERRRRRRRWLSSPLSFPSPRSCPTKKDPQCAAVCQRLPPLLLLHHHCCCCVCVCCWRRRLRSLGRTSPKLCPPPHQTHTHTRLRRRRSSSSLSPPSSALRRHYPGTRRERLKVPYPSCKTVFGGGETEEEERQEQARDILQGTHIHTRFLLHTQRRGKWRRRSRREGKRELNSWT